MSFVTDATSPVPVRVRLRSFLDERGVRYSWVAARLGITPSYMTRLMDEERPLIRRHAARLAEIFGVPIETFLAGEDQPGEGA